jgi:glyoxalase/bleomycin resistance protein/dioxygenase superfamily protein
VPADLFAAGPSDDPGRLRRIPYHVGFAARRFERGLEVLTDLFGFEWGPVVRAEALEFVTPDGPVQVEAATTHSRGGPMRVEVCAGTFWPTTADVEFHHFGYWSADVGADAADLERRGWTVEACAVDADGRPTEFAYLTKPGHPRIELVDLDRLPAYRERVGVDVPPIA